MHQITIIDFLIAFFNLFKAKIEKYKIVYNRIFGTVGWPNEDDKQDFVLKIDFDIKFLANGKLLCDYLAGNNLLNGDKVIVSESDLILSLKKAGWSESDAKESIDFLFTFGVEMIDDGIETDSFFIHF